MSIFDDFRDTSAELFAEFGTPAVITSGGTKTRDFVTGNIVAGGSTTKNVLAVIGERELVADDGAITVQTVAKSNGGAKAGDTLTIGTKSYTISDSKEVAPDGGVPMSYTLVLE